MSTKTIILIILGIFILVGIIWFINAPKAKSISIQGYWGANGKFICTCGAETNGPAYCANACAQRTNR